MAQKQLIARAGQGLLDVLTLLLRGTGALCAAIGSLFIWVLSNENPRAGDSVDRHDFYDGNSLIDKEEEARVSGWKTW